MPICPTEQNDLNQPLPHPVNFLISIIHALDGLKRLQYAREYSRFLFEESILFALLLGSYQVENTGQQLIVASNCLHNVEPFDFFSVLVDVNEKVYDLI